MTTPYERYRALTWAVDLMHKLAAQGAPENYHAQIQQIARNLPTREELDTIVDTLEELARVGGFPSSLSKGAP